MQWFATEMTYPQLIIVPPIVGSQRVTGNFWIGERSEWMSNKKRFVASRKRVIIDEWSRMVSAGVLQADGEG